MRFKSRFRGRVSTPREPKVWDRFNAANLTASNIKGAVANSVLWDPTSLITGSLDQRLTVMRLLVDGVIAINVSAGDIAAGDYLRLDMGIYLGSSGETKDPGFAAAGDEQTDWLWLHHTILPCASAGPFTFAPNIERNPLNTYGLLDVKAKRKVDQDQRLMFAVSAPSSFLPSGHTANTLTVTTRLACSVLFQRTMARR